MLRYLLLFSLALLTPTAFALDLPSFFTPVENDLSMYYLTAIFGKQLFPLGTSDILLMSELFAIFNQVALTVSLCVVIYTTIKAIFDTAAEGTPLGKGLNSLWGPIKMSLGMALLVPKAGTGYCLAQYLVAWMIGQGVGAADTLWITTLDYFIAGGGVRARGDEGMEEVSRTPKNKMTVELTYDLEELILINTTCVEAHNAAPARVAILGKYEIYATDNNKYLHFGNPTNTGGGTEGFECGRVIIPQFNPEHALPGIDYKTLQPQVDTIYIHLFDNMALNLFRLSKTLAGDNGADYEGWSAYFPEYRDNASYFLDGLIGYADILYPKPPTSVEKNRETFLQPLKDQGWILAGNYYSLLMKQADLLPTAAIMVPNPAAEVVDEPNDEMKELYADELQNAKDFHGPDPANSNPDDNPLYQYSFSYWTEKYVMPGFSDTGKINTGRKVSYAEINKKAEDAFRAGNIAAGLNVYTTAQREMARLTMSAGSDFTGGVVQRDPIVRAAQYGKSLTQGAIAMVLTTGGIFIAIALAAVCGAINPLPTAAIVSTAVILPLIYGAAGLMYTEGILLGVYLPLIPMIHFYMGTIGWMTASIEAMVASTIIAVGILFPGSREDTFVGRAEPGMFMIFNLMLRPTLMIMGFCFAMIITWISVELLNMLFVVFSSSVAQVEPMFGSLAVTMAYAVTLITVVSKVFELINLLPEKVLESIGGRAGGGVAAGEALREVQAGAKDSVGRGFVGGVAAGSQTAGVGMKEGKPETPPGDEGLQAGKGGGKGGKPGGGKGGDEGGQELNEFKRGKGKDQE